MKIWVLVFCLSTFVLLPSSFACGDSAYEVLHYMDCLNHQNDNPFFSSVNKTLNPNSYLNDGSHESAPSRTKTANRERERSARAIRDAQDQALVEERAEEEERAAATARIRQYRKEHQTEKTALFDIHKRASVMEVAQEADRDDGTRTATGSHCSLLSPGHEIEVISAVDLTQVPADEMVAIAVSTKYYVGSPACPNESTGYISVGELVKLLGRNPSAKPKVYVEPNSDH